jgi:hypothetical protein
MAFGESNYRVRREEVPSTDTVYRSSEAVLARFRLPAAKWSIVNGSVLHKRVDKHTFKLSSTRHPIGRGGIRIET